MLGSVAECPQHGCTSWPPVSEFRSLGVNPESRKVSGDLRVHAEAEREARAAGELRALCSEALSRVRPVPRRLPSPGEGRAAQRSFAALALFAALFSFSVCALGGPPQPRKESEMPERRVRFASRASAPAPLELRRVHPGRCLLRRS